jgi:hypothetical protein
MKIDTFSVWTPFELIKSDEAEPLTGRIGGIISTESTDQQGERVLQDGIDWTYFLKHGWFNYEHRAGPDNVLGHPEIVSETDFEGKPATRVEGVLYLHKAKAKEIYETAMAMQKAKTSRRLGFSVEGQVLSRDKNQIAKAKVLNVAITAHPVNPDARLEVLARSLTLDKGNVGYQTPTQPGTGSLSALVPQSISDKLAFATYGSSQKKRKRKMTVSELADMLTRIFTTLDSAQALESARKIANSV